MILSIGQYVEALTNSEGRFRTLRRVWPVCDEKGEVLFSVPGHGLVDFEISAGGGRISLRCPLRGGAEAEIRLRALAEKDKGLASEFFTPWRLLEKEIVLFDGAGNAVETDVLVRPAADGVTAERFLRETGDPRLVSSVLASIARLDEWSREVGREVSGRRLLFGPDGSVRVTGFSAKGDLDKLVARLTGFSGQSDEPAETGPASDGIRDSYEWEEDESDGIRCVRDVGGWRYVTGGDVPLTDRVWLFAAPFREGRAEVETAEGKGLIDKEGRHILEPVYEELSWDEYWGLVAVMTEGRWSLLDRGGTLLTEDYFDWLGECSEGLVLAQKDGKCGFIDTEGREAIPFVYDDATSFSEGCALVTVGDESFYIDGSGNQIDRQAGTVAGTAGKIYALADVSEIPT